MMDQIKHLIDHIGLKTLPHSRIHSLKTLGTKYTQCFVKRDDELGGGLGGAKIRKYASLIPHLLREKIQKVIIIGSAYSNNVLALTQRMIENRIEPILFLLQSASSTIKGNYLLTSLLAHRNIRWISRDQWLDVENHALQYAQKNFDIPYKIITEGALMPQALPGALTLGIDIVDNEKEYDLNFDHVFIEAGSGLMAIATILALAYTRPSIAIHVLLLADDEIQFHAKLNTFHAQFNDLIQAESCFPENFQLHIPQITPKSFGATNAKIFRSIVDLAKNEGFFTDPIYSVKLFVEAQKIMEDHQLKGNVLIIHSGGANTLLGFQEQLAHQILAPRLASNSEFLSNF